MRAPLISLSVLAIGLLAGCSTHRNAPYANDPVLLHYKPTLNDSATIIAEKQWHHTPAKPPKPSVTPDNPATDPTQLAADASASITSAKAEIPGQLLLPPPGNQTALAAQPLESPGSSLPVRPTAATEPAEVTSNPVLPATVSGPTLPPPAVGQAAEPIPVTVPEPVRVAKAEAAADPMAAPPPPPVPTAGGHRAVAGNYGHDNDYHWLQGVLERHYRGYYCIRYCDPSVEDANGGKVRLLENAMLEQFQEGDIIGVEGELIPNSTDSFHTNPRYHIRDAWLVRKK